MSLQTIMRGIKMKVNGISTYNLQFKGLWGNPHYSYTDTIKKGVECDFFEKTYYPCKDESDEEIKKALLAEKKELAKENVKGNEHPLKYYIYPVIGKRLKESLADLASKSA